MRSLIQLREGIRNAGADDVAALRDITSDAFRDDPFNKWVFGGYDPMQRTFGNIARHVYQPYGLCQLLQDEGEDRAAAMWLLPSDYVDISAQGMLETYWGLFASAGFSGLRRGKRTSEVMARHRPHVRHAYLFTVGVNEAGRGKGLGRRLLMPVIDACDVAGVMIYLENTNPMNRPFYRSLGFQQVELFHVMPGSPPLEAMIRRPK